MMTAVLALLAVAVEMSDRQWGLTSTQSSSTIAIIAHSPLSMKNCPSTNTSTMVSYERRGQE